MRRVKEGGFVLWDGAAERWHFQLDMTIASSDIARRFHLSDDIQIAIAELPTWLLGSLMSVLDSGSLGNRDFRPLLAVGVDNCNAIVWWDKLRAAPVIAEVIMSTWLKMVYDEDFNSKGKLFKMQGWYLSTLKNIASDRLSRGDKDLRLREAILENSVDRSDEAQILMQRFLAQLEPWTKSVKDVRMPKKVALIQGLGLSSAILAALQFGCNVYVHTKDPKEWDFLHRSFPGIEKYKGEQVDLSLGVGSKLDHKSDFRIDTHSFAGAQQVAATEFGVPIVGSWWMKDDTGCWESTHREITFLRQVIGHPADVSHELTIWDASVSTTEWVVSHQPVVAGHLLVDDLMPGVTVKVRESSAVMVVAQCKGEYVVSGKGSQLPVDDVSVVNRQAHIFSDAGPLFMPSTGDPLWGMVVTKPGTIRHLPGKEKMRVLGQGRLVPFPWWHVTPPTAVWVYFFTVWRMQSVGKSCVQVEEVTKEKVIWNARDPAGSRDTPDGLQICFSWPTPRHLDGGEMRSDVKMVRTKNSVWRPMVVHKVLGNKVRGGFLRCGVFKWLDGEKVVELDLGRLDFPHDKWELATRSRLCMSTMQGQVWFVRNSTAGTLLGSVEEWRLIEWPTEVRKSVVSDNNGFGEDFPVDVATFLDLHKKGIHFRVSEVQYREMMDKGFFPYMVLRGASLVCQ